LCQTNAKKDSGKKDKDKDKENKCSNKDKDDNHTTCSDHNCAENSMCEFVNLIKSDKFKDSNSSDNCTESAHYIQKFAKYCFHTKYLIIVHTAEFHPQVCLFLALILVRCNNRLCREFLNTIPNIYKQSIMVSGCITGYDESKTDANIDSKETLSEKIVFWKSHSEKNGLNVKKLIDKCNEVLKNDEDKHGGGLFGDSNGEKERNKKMVNYLEKIGSGFFMLNIHEQLINLINYAKITYGNPKISSLADICKEVLKEVKYRKSLSTNYEDYELKNYLKNFNNFKQHVMKTILNMSEGQMSIKKQLYTYIIDFVTNPKPLTSRKILCLVGPPGVGKTFISLAIARILFFNEDENPTDEEVKQLVYILSIPGITDENSLLGSNSVYVGAKPGLLTRELLFNNKLCRKLIVFDEIDKHSKYIEQLIPVLDYTQNDKITDNYFDIELDMRSSVLIATANDASNIHPILKDRLHIINVSGYNTYTKAKMVQSHIAPKLLTERSLDNNLLHIPIPVLESIIQKRTCEAGVRKLKEIVLDIITTVKLGLQYDYDIDLTPNPDDDEGFFISDEDAFNGEFTSKNANAHKYYKKYYGYKHKNIAEFYEKIKNRYNKCHKLDVIDSTKNPRIIITTNDLDIILNNREHRIDHIEDVKKWEPGKVIGLYATSMGIGGILPIAIKLNKSLVDKGILVTLGAKDTMKDSAMISTMLVSDYIVNLYGDDSYENGNNNFKNYFGIDKNNFKSHVEKLINETSPHIILDSSTPKDGPSAGGAFMIGYLSKLLNHTLSKKVGITGEISSNLTITAIGGLNMKINGAMQGGCRSVVIPKENVKDLINEIVYENSIDVKNTYQKRLAFIYYSESEKSYMMLVRTSPQNDIHKSDDEIKISSFDINIPHGEKDFLLVDHKSNNNYTFKHAYVPSLYKLKLDVENRLIDPNYGLNIKIYDNVTLADVMRSHFVVLGLENIDEIYYYMVMAKHVLDDPNVKEIKTIDVACIETVSLDGITKVKDQKSKLNETQINVLTNSHINKINEI
jgi:ATP-dependent Lon protease